MSSPEVPNVIDRAEKSLIRSYLISTDIESIKRGDLNRDRRRLMLLLNILNVILWVHAVIGFLADSNSSLHFYFLNPLYGYGYIGKIWNGAYTGGLIAVVANFMVFYINESRGTLEILNFKKMYERLEHPSTEEINSFLYFLRVAINVGKLTFVGIWIPMVGFRGLGAVIGAYKFNSVAFLIASIPVILGYMIMNYYAALTHIYTHLLIAQSTMYLKLRLSRVEKSLQSVVAFAKTETTLSQKTIVKKVVRVTNEQLRVLKDILTEVSDHNKCVKYWLKHEIIITGGVLANLVVATLGDIEWYYKLSTIVTVSGWAAPVWLSFINSAVLFVKIRSMAKILHSCQSYLRIREKFEKRSKSATVFRESQVSPTEVVKTKHQTLRMMHRVSSTFLRIGYTEGNGKSFSPASLGQFLSTIFFTSVMFLNSKSSAIKDLLSM